MESEADRYIGPPATRYAYVKEFWVECPKCAKAARVIKKELGRNFPGLSRLLRTGRRF